MEFGEDIVENYIKKTKDNLESLKIKAKALNNIK